MTHAIAASAWTLSGSMLSWAIPMVLFIVAATALHLRLSRPHRIPGHSDLVPARPAPPDPETAHAMAAAAGMTTEAGAGADPLPHEPAGALELAEAAEEDRPAAVHLPGAADPPEPQDAGSPGLPGAHAADIPDTDAADLPHADGPDLPRAGTGPLDGAGVDHGAAGPEAGE